jgi:hypothetical protein
VSRPRNAKIWAFSSPLISIWRNCVISRRCGRKNLEFCFLEIPSTLAGRLSSSRLRSQRFCHAPQEANPRKHAPEKLKCPEISLKQKFGACCGCGHARNRQSRTELAALAELLGSRRRVGATGRARKPRRQSRPLNDPASSPRRTQTRRQPRR